MYCCSPPSYVSKYWAILVTAFKNIEGFQNFDYDFYGV
jgi:hypothetical protein